MGLHWALPLSAALLRLSGLPEAALGELSASAPWNRGTEREKWEKPGENWGKSWEKWEKLGKIMGKMGKTGELLKNWAKKWENAAKNLGTTEKDVGIFRSFWWKHLGHIGIKTSKRMEQVTFIRMKHGDYAIEISQKHGDKIGSGKDDERWPFKADKWRQDGDKTANLRRMGNKNVHKNREHIELIHRILGELGNELVLKQSFFMGETWGLKVRKWGTARFDTWCCSGRKRYFFGMGFQQLKSDFIMGIWMWVKMEDLGDHRC